MAGLTFPRQGSMHIIVPKDPPVEQDVEMKDSGIDHPDPGRPKLMYVFVLGVFSV